MGQLQHAAGVGEHIGGASGADTGDCRAMTTRANAAAVSLKPFLVTEQE
jgi:hypothetical protein